MSSPTTIHTLVVGDVIKYETLSRPSGHCLEGLALVEKHPRDKGRLYAKDTFWNMGSENHVLSDEELATAERLFNIHDFTALKRGSESIWVSYAPTDRARITSQHGLVQKLYIRKGSQPDLDQRIANAERKVARAEQSTSNAQRDLLAADRELGELVIQKAALAKK